MSILNSLRLGLGKERGIYWLAILLLLLFRLSTALSLALLVEISSTVLSLGNPLIFGSTHERASPPIELGNLCVERQLEAVLNIG